MATAASELTQPERTAALTRKEIPEALASLLKKNDYANSVVAYCHEAYAVEGKEETRKATKDYMKEILTVVCEDIEIVADKMNKLLTVQAEQVEKLTCELNMVTNRLLLVKEQKAKALMDEMTDDAPPAVENRGGSKGLLIEDVDLPPCVVSERHTTVAERLSQIEDYDVIFRG